MEHRSAIENNKARLDIRARIFWIRRQQAFLDIRVFDPNACRQSNSSLSQCYATNEKEKKRNYNQRILQVEQGTFSPLVFSIYGDLGRECQAFYSRLRELLVEKRIQQSIHLSIYQSIYLSSAECSIFRAFIFGIEEIFQYMYIQ